MSPSTKETEAALDSSNLMLGATKERKIRDKKDDLIPKNVFYYFGFLFMIESYQEL